MKDPLTRKSAQVLMSEITIWLIDDNNIFFVYQFLVIYLFIHIFGARETKKFCIEATMRYFIKVILLRTGQNECCLYGCTAGYLYKQHA